MPDKYTITINNMSNNDKTFLLFQAPPTKSGKPEPKVFTNIFQASPKIQSGGGNIAEFELYNEWFAVIGTAPKQLTQGVKVSTSGNRELTLGTGGANGSPGDTFVVDTMSGQPADDSAAPKFLDEKKTKGAPANAFQITTTENIRYPTQNNITIGLGAKDAHGKIVPVGCRPAEGSQTYDFYPHMKFYISTAEYYTGQIVDIAQAGKTLEIDFLDPNLGGSHDVTYTLGSNGGYTRE